MSNDERHDPEPGDETASTVSPGGSPDSASQPLSAQPPAGPPPAVASPSAQAPSAQPPAVPPPAVPSPSGNADTGSTDSSPDPVPLPAQVAGAKTSKRRSRPRRKAPWWELPGLILLAILIAIVVKTFVVQPFYIPSESMERTLYGCPGCSGDRILVNKPIFDLRDPHPGDIVVFNAPNGWEAGEPVTTPPSNPVVRAVRGFGQLVGFVPPDDLVLVKRVIATGGQTVKGVSTNGGRTEQIMISDNGPKGPWRTLHENYVYLDYADTTANFGPVTIPKGRLWVMGDHRNRSADSRYHCAADGGGDGQDLKSCDPVASTVPIGDVIGKAFVIAWPPSRWRTLGTPTTFTDAAANGVLPLGVVLPVFVLRRRRRK